MPMSLYHEFRRAEKIAIPLVVPVISFFSAIFLFGIEVRRCRLVYGPAAHLPPICRPSAAHLPPIHEARASLSIDK